MVVRLAFSPKTGATRMPSCHTPSVRGLFCNATDHSGKRRLHPVKANRAGGADSEDGQTDRRFEVITFVTADGLVQLPGRLLRPSSKASKRRADDVLPTIEEQGLCIGNVFRIAATNGYDPSRRVNLLGFCRSVDLVSEAVEDVVLRSGGEVVLHCKELKSGLHETLQMTVALPYLFGVPPRFSSLSSAIVEGGGYVDRVYKEWHMYKQYAGSKGGEYMV